MARPLRIQYPGAAYHVMCRGDDRKPIFLDDNDRYQFLRVLSQSIKTYSVVLYCYVLMENHFHFFLETPLGNLSEFIRHLLITYTSRYNLQHKRSGHLFQGRYKSILIDKDTYAVMLTRYIHLNPVQTEKWRKRPFKERYQYLLKYPWSTLPGYIAEKKRDAMIDYRMVFEAYGGDTEKGRRVYGDAIREDLVRGLNIEEKIIAQSILGSDRFIDRFIKTVHGNSREIPAIRKMRVYKAKEKILRLVEEESGVMAEKFLHSRSPIRQIAMDLLYRYGGQKGPEIGALFGVDYSTVSQNRKRLKKLVETNPEVRHLLKRIETKLS
jgi:putative transposase